MDEKDRVRDLLRARVSKALMDGAEIVLDPRINDKAKLLIALSECIKILRAFQKKIDEEFWAELQGQKRLIRPPPSNAKSTTIPAPPRVARITKPPPTKGIRR